LQTLVQQLGPIHEVHPPAYALPRLLLAEDSQVEREQLQYFLQKGGYFVDTASDGLEALGKITRDPFHILLTAWMARPCAAGFARPTCRVMSTFFC
jgi:CheY-like chemotaxis protein